MISSEINDNDNADSHEQIENTERSPHSASSPITTSPSDIATPCGVATESSPQSQDQSLSGNVKKKKGKENWQLHSTHGSKESAMDIIMKPYKHVVKHTTKLIRGISTTYVCTVHVNCEHCYKLIEKQLPDDRRSQWTLSQLNKHSTTLAPKPRGIDPAIRAKVDEYACLGASPLHILETLVASGEVKRDELPTRDQISNRIHGRESKKRKTQMEAMQLQKQRSIELHQRQQQQLLEQQHLLQQQQKKQVQQQQLQHRQNLLQQQQYLQHQQQHQQQLVQQHLQLQQQLPFTYRPTSRSLEFEYETHNAEAYEQACLDLFGPNLLYHSVYYQEYGMGMVVSVSTDTIAAPINLNYPTDQIPPMSAPSNVPGAIPVNTSDAQINSELQGITITTLESLGQVQIPPIHHNHHRHNRQHHQLQHQHPHHPFLMIRPKLGDPLASTPLLSSSSASSGPSIHESIPLPESTVPRMSTMYSTPPPPPLQWTLLFIHTPPDENGYYMQCPLGCPDCVNGKVHLVVNRTLLLSGLMGAIDLAHAGSPSPAIHSTVLSSFQNGSSYYQPSHDVPPNVTYDPTPTSTSTSTHHSNIHPHQSL